MRPDLDKLESQLVAAFKAAGMEEPAFEARRLIQEATNLDESTIMDWARRRIAGEPLAYLSGRKGFYKSEFIVKPGVLIPRPETEHVVETALRRIHENKICVGEIADLGCGSGCIGLSLALELPGSALWSVDISEPPIAVTLENAKALGLASRVQAVRTAVESFIPEHKFDLIVANPPYIAFGDTQVELHVEKFEPHEALYSGPEGLEALRAWSAWAFRYLRSGGLFVAEFGAGQSQFVSEIMERRGFQEIHIEKDLAGHERVISGVRV